MRKKVIISFAVLCSLITILWIINFFTGMLQLYVIPTPANEPTIKQGERVFVSTLKDPAPYNFIAFTSKYEDSINMSFMPDLKPDTRYLQRLCGIPGDVIEMKNGTLYINGKNFDAPLNLNLQYKISSAKLSLIEEEDIAAMEKSSGFYMQGGDSAFVTFDSIMFKKYAAQTTPVLFIMPSSEQGPFVWNNKNDIWTTDNFGPLKIPADRYFVLGDNRHNAMDSRYTGFVKKEDIKGVVLNK